MADVFAIIVVVIIVVAIIVVILLVILLVACSENQWPVRHIFTNIVWPANKKAYLHIFVDLFFISIIFYKTISIQKITKIVLPANKNAYLHSYHLVFVFVFFVVFVFVFLLYCYIFTNIVWPANQKGIFTFLSSCLCLRLFSVTFIATFKKSNLILLLSLSNVFA